VIVVMRHTDDRRGNGKPERMAEMTWTAGRRIEVSDVQHRSLPRAKEAQACWKFFEGRSADCGGESSVIPCAEPRRDALGPDPDALHRGPQSTQRVARKIGAMLLAGKAFFFIVANDTRSAVARDFDECDAGVMETGGADPCEVDRFPTFDPRADSLKLLQCEAACRTKNLLGCVKAFQDRQHAAKSCCREPRVSRTDSKDRASRLHYDQ